MIHDEFTSRQCPRCYFESYLAVTQIVHNIISHL